MKMYPPNPNLTGLPEKLIRRYEQWRKSRLQKLLHTTGLVLDPGESAEEDRLLLEGEVWPARPAKPGQKAEPGAIVRISGVVAGVLEYSHE